MSLNSTIPVLVTLDDASREVISSAGDPPNLDAIASDVAAIADTTTMVHDDQGALVESETTIQDKIADAETHLGNIENELGKQSDSAGSNTISGQIKQISQATGHPTDEATENSVIGLLKSIVNKLS